MVSHPRDLDFFFLFSEEGSYFYAVDAMVYILASSEKGRCKHRWM